MLTLRASIGETAITDPEAMVDFYWNVNAAGLASGAADKKINGKPIPLFADQAPTPGHRWLMTEWLLKGWLASSSDASAEVETPAVCFGVVKIAAKAVDATGNAQSGSMNETELFVNSTPIAPSRFTRGTFAGGRQSFTFVESPQLKVA